MESFADAPAVIAAFDDDIDATHTTCRYRQQFVASGEVEVIRHGSANRYAINLRPRAAAAERIIRWDSVRVPFIDINPQNLGEQCRQVLAIASGSECRDLGHGVPTVADRNVRCRRDRKQWCRRCD